MQRRLAVTVLGCLALTGCLSACTAPSANEVPPDASGTSAIATGPEITDDAWVGHFDERASSIEAAGGVSWGSFGPDGEAVAAGWTEASLPAGGHSVTIECAGPASVNISIAAPDGGPELIPAGTLACPGGATYAVTTVDPGISITADSDGAPGAYLFALDVAP